MLDCVCPPPERPARLHIRARLSLVEGQVSGVTLRNAASYTISIVCYMFSIESIKGKIKYFLPQEMYELIYKGCKKFEHLPNPRNNPLEETFRPLHATGYLHDYKRYNDRDVDISHRRRRCCKGWKDMAGRREGRTRGGRGSCRVRLELSSHY